MRAMVDLIFERKNMRLEEGAEVGGRNWKQKQKEAWQTRSVHQSNDNESESDDHEVHKANEPCR
jgi:hypothetical protein